MNIQIKDDPVRQVKREHTNIKIKMETYFKDLLMTDDPYCGLNGTTDKRAFNNHGNIQNKQKQKKRIDKKQIIKVKKEEVLSDDSMMSSGFLNPGHLPPVSRKQRPKMTPGSMAAAREERSRRIAALQHTGREGSKLRKINKKSMKVKHRKRQQNKIKSLSKAVTAMAIEPNEYKVETKNESGKIDNDDADDESNEEQDVDDKR